MGHRLFDLGNLAVNNGFGADEEELLLEEYFGAAPTAQRRATLALMKLMSDFREAMWGAVQSAVSTLEFDFAAYAAEHFARLEATAGSPGYSRWLEDARGSA